MEVIRAGFLQKLSPLGVWTRYWAVLSHGKIACFLTPHDAVPAELLLLTQYMVIPAAHRPFAFQILLPNPVESWTIACDSEVERQEWMDALLGIRRAFIVLGASSPSRSASPVRAVQRTAATSPQPTPTKTTGTSPDPLPDYEANLAALESEMRSYRTDREMAVGALQTENEDLAKQLAEVLTQFQSYRERKEHQIQEQDDNIEAVIAEMERIQRQFQEYKVSVSSDLDAARAQNKELREHIEILLNHQRHFETERVELQTQIQREQEVSRAERRRADDVVHSSETQSVTIRREIERKEEQWRQQRETEQRHLAHLQREFQEYKEFSQKELHRVTRERDDNAHKLQERLRRDAENAQHLQHQYTEQREQIARLQQKYERQQDEFEQQLEARSEAHRREMRELSAKYESEITHTRSERHLTEEKLQLTQTEHLRIQREMEHMVKDRQVALESDKTRAERLASDLEAQLRQSEEATRSALLKVDMLTSECETLRGTKQQLQDARQQISELEQAAENLQQQLTAAQAKSAKAASRRSSTGGARGARPSLSSSDITPPYRHEYELNLREIFKAITKFEHGTLADVPFVTKLRDLLKVQETTFRGLLDERKTIEKQLRTSQETTLELSAAKDRLEDKAARLSQDVKVKASEYKAATEDARLLRTRIHELENNTRRLEATLKESPARGAGTRRVSGAGVRR